MALVCQFVDSIFATPTLRLNLNAASWTTLASTDFGFPEMRRAISSTLLTDGEHVPASAYGNRVLHLDLQVNTSSVDDTATELQKLVRELNRPTNLLRTQLGSAPVFFRTLRSSPEDWRVITDGALVNISAAVLAEPFALGLREDPQVLQAVAANPAGANGCFLDVTGVKGDVEAPAYIRWPSADIAVGQETLFAVRRRGTPSAALFLRQAEGLTQGTDTTTQVNDANFSGTGNNYSRCTFTTATMQTRLSLTDLGTASVDLRGRYRVFMRYRKNTAADDINVRLIWGEVNLGFSVTNATYVLPDFNVITYADLGEISIPFGPDPVTDPAGTEIPVSDQFRFSFQAERTAGSGTLDIDFLLFVPADDRLSIVKWPDPGSSYWLLNAEDNSAHNRNASDQVYSAGPPSVAGGMPMLSPGQTNRVVMVRQVRPGALSLFGTDTVSISYWPRYLSVRPAST